MNKGTFLLRSKWVLLFVGISFLLQPADGQQFDPRVQVLKVTAEYGKPIIVSVNSTKGLSAETKIRLVRAGILKDHLKQAKKWPCIEVYGYYISWSAEPDGRSLRLMYSPDEDTLEWKQQGRNEIAQPTALLLFFEEGAGTNRVIKLVRGVEEEEYLSKAIQFTVIPPGLTRPAGNTISIPATEIAATVKTREEAICLVLSRGYPPDDPIARLIPLTATMQTEISADTRGCPSGRDGERIVRDEVPGSQAGKHVEGAGRQSQDFAKGNFSHSSGF